jgi:PAS domain S-box-containing protein
MSSEAGSSSFLPGAEQNSTFSPVEDFIFMLLLDVGRVKFPRWAQLLGYVVCFLQLLSLALPPEFPWQESWIVAILKYLRVMRTFTPHSWYHSYQIIVGIFCTSCSVVFAMTVLLLWMFRYNSSGNLRATTLYLLATRVCNVSLVAFSPLLCGILVVWRCEYDEATNGETTHLRGGSGTACFGTTNTIFLSFSTLALVVVLPCFFLLAVGAFDYRLTSRNVFSSISGMNSLSFVATVSLMSFAEIVLLPFSYAGYGVVAVFIFLVWAFRMLDQFPYFRAECNHVATGLLAVCVFASCISFAVSFARSAVAFYCFLALFLAFFFLGHVCSKRKLLFVSTLRTSTCSFLAARSGGSMDHAIQEHETERVLPIEKPRHVELFARSTANVTVQPADNCASDDGNARKSENPASKYMTVFQLGRELFPESPYVSLCHALYVLVLSGNTRQAFRLSSEVIGHPLSFSERNMLWSIRKVISEIEDGRGGEENLRRRLQVARKHQSHCRAALKKFWSLLLKDNCDMRQLTRIIAMIAEHENAAENTFRRLLTEYGQSPRLLRAYGEFLMEVKQEEVVAKLYFQRAEMAEENEQFTAHEGAIDARVRKARLIASRIHQIERWDSDDFVDERLTALEAGWPIGDEKSSRSFCVEASSSMGDNFDRSVIDPHTPDYGCRTGQSYDDSCLEEEVTSPGRQSTEALPARGRRVKRVAIGNDESQHINRRVPKPLSGFVDVHEIADGECPKTPLRRMSELSEKRKLCGNSSSIASYTVETRAMERHVLMESIRRGFRKQARPLQLASFLLILLFLLMLSLSFYFLVELFASVSAASEAVANVGDARSYSMNSAAYVKMMEAYASAADAGSMSSMMPHIARMSSRMQSLLLSVFDDSQASFSASAHDFWSSHAKGVSLLYFPYSASSQNGTLSFTDSNMALLDMSAVYSAGLSAIAATPVLQLQSSLSTWDNRSQNMDDMFIVKNGPIAILEYFDKASDKYAVDGFNSLLGLESTILVAFGSCAVLFIVAATLCVFVPIYRREMKNHHAALRLFCIVPKSVLKRISKSFRKPGAACHTTVDEAAERDVQMDMMEWVEESSGAMSTEGADRPGSHSLIVRFSSIVAVFIVGIVGWLVLGLVMAAFLSPMAYVVDLSTKRLSLTHTLHLLAEQWASPSVPLSNANQFVSGAFPYNSVESLKTSILEKVSELRQVHHALQYGDSKLNIPSFASLQHEASQVSLANNARCAASSFRNIDGSIPEAAIRCMSLNDLLLAFMDQISRLVEGLAVGTGASCSYLQSIRLMNTGDLSSLLTKSTELSTSYYDSTIQNAQLGSQVTFGIVFPFILLLSCVLIGAGLKNLQAEHVHTKRMLLLLPADVINNTPVILQFLLSGKRVDELRLQESLKEEQEKTKAILLSTADGVIICDDYGLIEMANPAMTRIFGYCNDELIGSNVKMILPPKLAERHDALIRAYCDAPARASKLVGRSIESQGFNKAGLLVPVRVTLTEATIHKRRFFSAFIQDLTEVYRERGELQAQFVRMQAVMQASTEAVFVTDEQGNMTVVNDAACRLFEYSREELVGANVSMLMPEPHRSRHHQYIENFLFTGRSKMVATGREVYAVKKSGVSFQVHANVMHGKVDSMDSNASENTDQGLQSVVNDGRQRASSFFAAYIRDMSESKKREEELILNTERVQAVIKASTDAVIVCDDKGTIESVNPSFTSILGYQRDEIVGQNVRLLVPLGHRSQHDLYIRSYLKTGTSRIVGSGNELEAIDKNGQSVACFLTVREGRLRDRRFFACFLRDIRESQQMQMSKNREIDSIKTMFASIVPPSVAQRLLKEAALESRTAAEPWRSAEPAQTTGLTSVSNEFASVDEFPSCTIFFSDLVNFTRFSSQRTPVETVTMISRVLGVWDDLIMKHKLEKVKNIGDAVLAVSNMYVPRSDHAHAVCEYALDLIEHIKRFNADNNLDIGARIGINTGSVVAGILKTRFKTWDIYSDSVNMASRMEHSGQSMRVHVSENTYALVRDYYDFEENYVQAKGVGQLTTYFITKRKDQI